MNEGKKFGEPSALAAYLPLVQYPCTFLNYDAHTLATYVTRMFKCKIHLTKFTKRPKFVLCDIVEEILNTQTI